MAHGIKWVNDSGDTLFISEDGHPCMVHVYSIEKTFDTTPSFYDSAAFGHPNALSHKHALVDFTSLAAGGETNPGTYLWPPDMVFVEPSALSQNLAFLGSNNSNKYWWFLGDKDTTFKAHFFRDLSTIPRTQLQSTFGIEVFDQNGNAIFSTRPVPHSITNSTGGTQMGYAGAKGIPCVPLAFCVKHVYENLSLPSFWHTRNDMAFESSFSAEGAWSRVLGPSWTVPTTTRAAMCFDSGCRGSQTSLSATNPDAYQFTGMIRRNSTSQLQYNLDFSFNINDGSPGTNWWWSVNQPTFRCITIDPDLLGVTV